MTIEQSILGHVGAIPPYVPGRPIAAVARDFGLEPRSIIKLASNENPLGMSPAAQRFLATLADDPTRYPDADCYELRAHLAMHLGVSAENILIGAGSSELIQLAVRAVIDPRYTAVMSQYAFIAYEAVVRSVGAQPIVVPAQQWGHDLSAMLSAIDSRVRLVFVASPNNPTGTMLASEELRRFIDAVPADVLIVLDEAYRDYVDEQARPPVIPWILQRENLLVLRTFSKVYGLAGLRVGYALGSRTMTGMLRRLQLPFSVGVLAQGAAMASLADAEFVRTAVAMNATERSRLCAAFDKLGLEYVPSFGNFVLVRVGDADRIFAALMRAGIVVRPVANYGLKEWVRVSVGLAEQNETFLTQLTRLIRQDV